MGLAVSAGLFALPAASRAIIIDDFSAGSYTLFVNSASPVAEAVRNGGAGSILGLQRDAMLQYVSGPQGVEAQVGSGGVQFFNDHSETAGNLYLQYDGIDGELETDLAQTPGTNLGANLGSQNAFRLRFTFVNGGLAAPVSLAITVTDGSGSSTVTTNVASGLNINHSVAFSAFSGVSFSNVRRLDFKLIGPASADFTLDSIEAVPEPATLTALAVGALALARRRRRAR